MASLDKHQFIVSYPVNTDFYVRQTADYTYTSVSYRLHSSLLETTYTRINTHEQTNTGQNPAVSGFWHA